MIPDDKYISVYGARVHNLKNIDVSIPRNKLTVITGLSGSGKSSLAFDTIYAEGQRRYIETFSAYVRQFLGNMERPDVDKITGLSPVISIEQRTTSRNPRSTVGTVTEIYDFLRLLYARAGTAYSYASGEKMVKYTDDQMVNIIYDNFIDQKIFLLAPVVKGRKGHYKELFEQIRKKGFISVRIDGKIEELRYGMKIDRYKMHNIEIVIDKLQVTKDMLKRIKTSLQTALHHGKGVSMILNTQNDEIRYLSRQLMCPVTGLSYNEPAPHSFSFNSPVGACPKCKGLGVINQVDMAKIIPDRSLSISKGGIVPLGKYKSSLIFWQLEAIASKYKFSLHDPIDELPDEIIDLILYGSDESFSLINTPLGLSSNYMLSFPGIISMIVQSENDDDERTRKLWAEQFIIQVTCPECEGTRLKKEALYFRLLDKNIAQLSKMDISELTDWFSGLSGQLSDRQRTIAAEIIKEINTRLRFLLNVGLDYLSLDRSAGSLSGGESQRIRLATQIGSQLVNVLYILDEPSIGLHPRDNIKLINALKDLRDSGNSVIVVEHDKEMMLQADYIIDMGPYAGRNGGKIVAQGSPEQMITQNSLTAQYLKGELKIDIPGHRRQPNGKWLVLEGAKGNNLKNITVKLPLGTFICVTGVSGSGKSSLVADTLYPILTQHFYHSFRQPLPYSHISGIEFIDKVIEVDQSPIGRTPRSNPVTYTGIFSDIRVLFEKLPEAKIRGYKAGRFSFNVKGGRCEGCRGAGVKTIEMNFLPDVYVHCDQCNGKRYNRETLEVRYRGKSISDVLDMTFNQASEFFEAIPSLVYKINTVREVGLGYLKLGQPSTTLSGGESQRIKLAAELSKRETGKTLYILDEPTTGLHFEDIRILIQVLDKLVDKGNTVIVIEHNLDVIKVADFIVDMGLEGGKKGGEILCQCTPEEMIHYKDSYTANFLRKELSSLKEII